MKSMLKGMIFICTLLSACYVGYAIYLIWANYKGKPVLDCSSDEFTV
jgi:hypothetical protein